MPTLLAVVALFAIGLALQWIHPLEQAAAYHVFADSRAWLGIPNAANVLSNLPISLAGLAILGWVQADRAGGGRLRSGLLVSGIGLALTGVGSAYYHYAPGDATLIWDRLPLAIVFAGALLTAWSCTAAPPPDGGEVALLVLASLGSVAFWVYLDSLWPYAMLQFGGLAALLYLAWSRRVVAVRAWWCVILLYALAKVVELLDHEIWRLTQETLSGHTLKHLASAAAGFAFLWIASDARRATDATGATSAIARPT
jgi:hypothetical protein